MIPAVVVALSVRLEYGVRAPSGTNGYVSTWGEAFAGCEPSADSA